MGIPVEIAAVCGGDINTQLITEQSDRLVNRTASFRSGHASAVATLARFGSAATGDPLYDAGVQLGKLLRTSFLADYFTNPPSRHELRRVLNRGEDMNAMERLIYTGRIAPAKAKRPEEVQAVLGRWANRRQLIAPGLSGKIVPIRLEGINLRGVFLFPTERYAEKILPSRPIEKNLLAA